MRHLALAIFVAAIPAIAAADESYIQLEAWQSNAEAEAAAARWAGQMDDVVTYRMGRSWVAVGIGPVAGDAKTIAERLSTLKADRSVPRDAFIIQLGDDVAVTSVDAAGSAVDADDISAHADTTPAKEPAKRAGTDTAATADPDTAPAEAAAPPRSHIRIEAFSSREAAETALNRWREVLPNPSLWHLPTGWFGITVGPVDPDDIQDWLTQWKQAGAIPSDAFIESDDKLGDLLHEGGAPQLDAPPAPVVMPPLTTVQEVLRWAGHYDGEIDGRTGPKTNAAIAAALAEQDIAPDSHNAQAVAMQALLARREAWQDEMGLETLSDEHTGLSLTAPLRRLEFLRIDRGLAIYGPKDESGAALILFNQPGGRSEMADLAGLITALGWVPHPDREIGQNGFTLDGRNDDHIGHAEGRMRDGQIEGFVLIWPVGDAANAPRLIDIASASLVATPDQTDEDVKSAD